MGYYENPTGKVTALSMVNVFVGTVGEEYPFVDITSQESQSLPDSYRNTPALTTRGYSKTLDESLEFSAFTLNPPFTCAVDSSDGSTIDGFFYLNGSGIQGSAYWTGPNGAANFSQSTHLVPHSKFNKLTLKVALGAQYPNPNQDNIFIHQSDIAVFADDTVIWINGTNPVIVAGSWNPPLPDNVFPFTRLAYTTSADQSFTYLYHQINGTTFAEEQWDNALFSWTATQYITISYL